MKMSTEPERYLEGGRRRRGACSVGVSRSAVVCGVLSRLRSAAADKLRVKPALELDQVASSGAQLRSALVYGAVDVSSLSRSTWRWSEREVPDA
jgi:hypothetical protein